MLPDKISLSASWPLAFGLACLAESINDPSWPLRQELTRRLTQEASHAPGESSRDSHAVDV